MLTKLPQNITKVVNNGDGLPVWTMNWGTI